MAFSYLNNMRLKFNNNSCWFASNRDEYRQFIVIETLIRETIKKNLIRDRSFYLFELNNDIRKQQKINIIINFKYQLASKKLKNEEVVQKVKHWIHPICKRLNIAQVNIKAILSTGEKSATCFAQVLSNEMTKYISNRKIRMLAKSHISSKNLGYIIKISGRINGNSIARYDSIQTGIISRNNLRYDIDYAEFTHINKSGCVGIKVWINRGLLPSPDQIANDLDIQQNEI